MRGRGDRRHLASKLLASSLTQRRVRAARAAGMLVVPLRRLSLSGGAPVRTVSARRGECP